jgi:diadenosine tetraphosphatase ApaH/serine/threonine PP2A family protein phosphatase
MEYLIEFRNTPFAQVEGDARCGKCAWSALLLGDSQDEVDLFLTALVVEHALHMHEDLLTDADAMQTKAGS